MTTWRNLPLAPDSLGSWSQQLLDEIEVRLPIDR